MKIGAKSLSELTWDDIKIGLLVMMPLSSISKVVAEVVGLNEKDKTIEIEWGSLLSINRVSIRHHEANNIEVC